eukprot:scaffold70955_cov18-Phaeocystis_antarctica.AAC.1
MHAAGGSGRRQRQAAAAGGSGRRQRQAAAAGGRRQAAPDEASTGRCRSGPGRTSRAPRRRSVPRYALGAGVGARQSVPAAPGEAHVGGGGDGEQLRARMSM